MTQTPEQLAHEVAIWVQSGSPLDEIAEKNLAIRIAAHDAALRAELLMPSPCGHIRFSSQEHLAICPTCLELDKVRAELLAPGPCGITNHLMANTIDGVCQLCHAHVGGTDSVPT